MTDVYPVVDAIADNSSFNSRSERGEAANVRDRTLQMSSSCLNFEVTDRVNVRSNNPSWAFSSMDFETLHWASLVTISVRIVQNRSSMCVTRISFTWESRKHGLVMV